MQKYKPSGIVPFQAFIGLSIVVLIGGIAVGAAVGGVAQFIYLVVLFPVVMGYVGGQIVRVGVRTGKVRNRMVAALFGFLVGIIMYGSYLTVHYVLSYQKIINDLAAQRGVTADTADKAVQQGVISKTGSGGILGFYLLEAQVGIKIVDVGSSVTNTGSPMLLQGGWAYFYWAAELFVVMALAAGVGWQAAAVPFCENCQKWYNKAARVGSVDRKSGKAFLKAFKAGQLDAAKAMFATQPVKAPRTDLTARFCGTCNTSDFVMDVKKVSRNRGRELPQTVYSALMTRQEALPLIRTTTTTVPDGIPSMNPAKIG